MLKEVFYFLEVLLRSGSGSFNSVMMAPIAENSVKTKILQTNAVIYCPAGIWALAVCRRVKTVYNNADNVPQAAADTILLKIAVPPASSVIAEPAKTGITKQSHHILPSFGIEPRSFI